MLDCSFCFFEKGKRHAHLKGRKVLQIEQMVFAADGFVGDSRFVEYRAKLGVQARIVTLPKRTKGIFFVAGRPAGIRCERIGSLSRKLVDQIDVAVGRVGEPRPVLDATLWTKHNRQCSTNDEPPSYPCSFASLWRKGRSAIPPEYLQPHKTKVLKAEHRPRGFLRLFATRTRITVRMNATNSCPSAKQAGLAFASPGAQSFFRSLDVFGPAVTFSTLMGDETKTIARGLQRRDPDLLDRLIEQYQYRLFRYLMYITGDKARAEDFFQETWIRVLERGHQYDGKSKFEAWLFAIARHLVIDWQRTKKAQSLDALIDPEQEKPLQVADESEPSPVDQVLARERKEDVQSSLRKIPAIYREVLILRFQEELQIEEMAGLLNIPVSTVKSRLYRGLDALRGAFEEGGA